MSRERVWVTGVSSGVGLSLARHLAERFHVVGFARTVEAARAALGDLPNVDLVGADLAATDELEARLRQAVAEHGFPSRLVNNAGTLHRARVEALEPDALAHAFAVNCLAPLTLMRLVLPAMAERGFGRIVNVTSGAPLNCVAGFAAYSASKAALNALTVTAAREYPDGNVRVNLMSPGPVRSNMAPDAPMDPDVCHPTLDYLLDADPAVPSGGFFWLGHEIPLFPDLEGVEWLAGRAPERFRRLP